MSSGRSPPQPPPPPPGHCAAHGGGCGGRHRHPATSPARSQNGRPDGRGPFGARCSLARQTGRASPPSCRAPRAQACRPRGSPHAHRTHAPGSGHLTRRSSDRPGCRVEQVASRCWQLRWRRRRLSSATTTAAHHRWPWSRDRRATILPFVIAPRTRAGGCGLERLPPPLRGRGLLGSSSRRDSYAARGRARGRRRPFASRSRPGQRKR